MAVSSSSSSSTPKKRSAGTTTSSSPATKKHKNSSSSQTSITSFFTSPNNTSNKKQHQQPKSEDQAWEQDTATIDADERFARQLQAEWDAEAKNAASTSSTSASATSAYAPAPGPSKPIASSSTSSKIKEETVESSSSNTTLSLINTTQAAKLSNPASIPSPLKNTTLNAAPVDLNALDAAIEAIPLGQDIFTFDPYAVDTSPWPHTLPNTKSPGEEPKPITPYALLTHAFVLVSSTKSRITITTVLTNLLRVLRIHDPQAILPAVYLISNHIAPPYDGIELGIGGSIVHKAIQSVTGKSGRYLKNLWDRTGDPGDVAFEAKKDIKMLTKPAPITVAKLFSTLHTIARLSGAGSQSAKLSHVTKLLVASRGEETRFLARTFIAHLRIQAVRTTMATSLARAFALVDTPHAPGDPRPISSSSSSSKATVPSAKSRGKAKASETDIAEHSAYLIHPHERQGLLAHPTKTKDRQNERWIELTARMAKAERVVREVRARHPNFSSIVPALLDVGLDGLSQHVPLRIGTPLSPMLASITRSLPSMFDKMGTRPFVSEYKYDGQRVQIHAALLPKTVTDSSSPDAALDEMLFATGTAEGDARLRPILVESGRGKWVKAGQSEDQLVYVRLFSRHLEDQTDKYPDVLELVPLLLAQGKQAEGEDGPMEGLGRSVRSFILDAEVVAIGTSSEELLPFQTLASRSRKDVQLKDVKVKVGIFAFDLMYLNGQPLLKTAFRQRRQLLKKHFPPLAPDNPMIACFGHVKSCESMDPEEVKTFFEEARAAHCEGIMVKSLDHFWEDAPTAESVQESNGHGKLRKLNDVVGNDMEMDDVPDEEKGSKGKKPRGENAEEVKAVGKGVNGRGKALLSTYEPDKRCESWLKVKGDYLDSQDTLDLVPIGGWHGMGRKSQWWSPVLLAVYDPETGVYQALCKCISGFTDAEYKRIKFEAYAENTDDCQESTSSTPPFEVEYDSALTPAFWWRPKEVWEIRCADITLSPVYTAARGQNLGVDTTRGLSIRFPRFIKRRVDKGVEEATTPGQLAGMFREQMARAPAEEVVVAGGKGEGGDDHEDMGEDDVDLMEDDIGEDE